MTCSAQHTEGTAVFTNSLNASEFYQYGSDDIATPLVKVLDVTERNISMMEITVYGHLILNAYGNSQWASS